MKASPSIAKQILWVLMDAPRPLFLSEIVESLGGDYPGTYIMPTLIWLKEQRKIGARKMQRGYGKGPKVANAYFYTAPDDLLLMAEDKTLETSYVLSGNQGNA
ncbi:MULTISPECIES: hypothetical protein [Chromobacterium]|uniref:hypothetical protein n=1 Tax=Chromobacterium TaxID=535 RepID=UPI0012F90598|nr:MULTISPECIES: hypothetical protein [Chromobacterium]